MARRLGIDLEPADFFVEPALADGTHGVAVRQELSLVAAGSGRQTQHFLEPRHPTPQGSRTVMTANTADVIELKQPHATRTVDQGPVRDRRDPAARPRAGQHVRLGDPQGPARRPDDRHAAGGRADRHHRRRRVPGHGDGRGRQLQRRLGGAGHPALAARRPQAALPHRGLGRVGHRLRGGLEGEAVEGRRRGRHPLQPGRRRRRGVQRRRPDELVQPADLGLRDHGRLVRPVLQGAVAPADAAAQAPDLGGGRLLHAGAGDRLPHAVRPCAAHAQARRQRAGLGRCRRPGLDGDPADRGLGRATRSR